MYMFISYKSKGEFLYYLNKQICIVEIVLLFYIKITHGLHVKLNFFILAGRGVSLVCPFYRKKTKWLTM